MAHTDTPTTTTERKPLDLSRLTLGEVAKIEELSGLPMAAMANMADNPQGKLLAAMVFVSERRHGHAIKWHECLDMDMSDALDLLGMAEDDDEDAEGDEDAEVADDSGE